MKILQQHQLFKSTSILIIISIGITIPFCFLVSLLALLPNCVMPIKQNLFISCVVEIIEINEKLTFVVIVFFIGFVHNVYILSRSFFMQRYYCDSSTSALKLFFCLVNSCLIRDKGFLVFETFKFVCFLLMP